MPLVKGPKARTKQGIKTNIEREMKAGKPHDQAVAIAMAVAGKKRKR